MALQTSAITRRGFVGATVGLLAAVATGRTVSDRPARQAWRSEPMYFKGERLHFDDECELDIRRVQVFDSVPLSDLKKPDWHRGIRKTVWF